MSLMLLTIVASLDNALALEVRRRRGKYQDNGVAVVSQPARSWLPCQSPPVTTA